ncbi:MAG: hypothetical protein QNJ41_16140 [Xenococcaceae cyanobacterium MO_188.B32]|nr:hypothetical protein [Xenococcaceae cyanobacterium MO_188.B32]
MVQQKSNEQAGISNNSINLRSLVSTLAVVLLIGFSSSLLSRSDSSHQSGSYSPGMSDQERVQSEIEVEQNFKNRVRGEDLEFFYRLMEEFQAELALLDGRVDNIESRVQN